ncbi:MAG: Crp/Fnr family transcriptional regulator [Rhodospirillaceae bacterium]
MLNRWLRDVSAFSDLSADDRRSLASIGKLNRAPAGEALTAPDGNPGSYLIVSGIACFASREQDERLITDIFVPGEFFSAPCSKAKVNSLEALTMCTYAFFDHSALLPLVGAQPSLGRALWRVARRREGSLRETIANVGRRPARERVAYFLLDLHHRLSNDNETPLSRVLPLSNVQIAGATALSPVHVGRVMADLEQRGLVRKEGRRLILKDPTKLMTLIRAAERGDMPLDAPGQDRASVCAGL